MSDAKEVEFSLKVFINKEKTKVLFAEAENDFADVLLSFLTLSLGKVIKILEKHYGDKAPSFGSLTSLMKGLANPDMVKLWNSDGKQVLDNPKISFSQHSSLKVSLDYTEPTKYAFGKPYDGVFTQNSASFIISDDLLMVPDAMGSIMQTLSKLDIDLTDMQGAEMRNVTFGLKEIIQLLKGSLTSRTPLSDLVLDQRQAKLPTVKCEPGISLDHVKNETTSTKMTLKIMFQKSSKKLLFAQAEEDFVDFLFSLLIIPLGMVEWLLGKNTGLNNIDNLYMSITDHIHDKYLKVREVNDSLRKPLCVNIYALNFYLPVGGRSTRYCYEIEGRAFVGGSRSYMVTDDLTVTRLSVSSSLSVLNEMKIPLSDVEEVEVKIGLEEALSVVKASLTSNCALTDGLINPKSLELWMQSLSVVKASLTSNCALTDGLIDPFI